VSIIAMKNTLIAVIALLVIMPTAFCASQLEHDVLVEINTAGNATVTESFVLNLNENEETLFDTISQKSTNNLTEWQKLYSDIQPYVLGNITSFQISTSKISGGQFGNEVRLEYTISDFAHKTDTIGRYDYYLINESQFAYYNARIGYFNIGSSDLTIVLPDTDKDTDLLSAKPQPWVSNNNNLRWISGTTASTFRIEYKQEIAISESFDLNRLIDTYFIKKPMYGAAIVLVIVFCIFFRKQIISLIGESFYSEGEIKLPKKEI
jgi:hypothetical protein